MTNQEAADELQHAIDLIKQDGKDWLDERDIPILEAAISALQEQEAKRSTGSSLTQRELDTISRQAVLELTMQYCPDDDGSCSKAGSDIRELLDDIENLPSAQPEQTRIFVELVVEYPDPELCTYKEYRGKPYYSIKYIENGERYVGYGTYKPEVLSQYLKEYFISSAQPDIIHCGECKHRDPEDKKCECGHDILWQLPREDDWFCADAERKEGGADGQTD